MLCEVLSPDIAKEAEIEFTRQIEADTLVDAKTPKGPQGAAPRSSLAVVRGLFFSVGFVWWWLVGGGWRRKSGTESGTESGGKRRRREIESERKAKGKRISL